MIGSRGLGYGHRPVSRRGVLVVGVAALLGAGGGLTAGLLRPLHPQHSRKPAPQDLVDALAAERLLLARVEPKPGQTAALRAVYDVVHADHQAHITALEAALQDYAPQRPVPAPVVPHAPTRELQRAAEAAAATAAARRAARLSGRDAALLASIAACEASHAEVLR